MKIEVCFSPALYKYYTEKDNEIVIIVDIFRATTTICTAFSNGVKSIVPVASVEEAEKYKTLGYLVGAERNVKRCDFADFGNSPFEYTPEKVKEQEIVFTTTNGTRAIKEAATNEYVIIGAFSNLSAVRDFCISKNNNIVILCSGWNNRFNMEDSLFAGALIDFLLAKGDYTLASDAAQVALSMWKEAKPNVREYINKSEHIKRLEANNLEDSADYCLTLDTVNVVPVYNNATGKLTVI